MPLGVVISKAEIMDWVPGSHASTFGGNPICIAAALATLDVIEKEGLLKNSQQVGDYMRKKMADWPKKHKLVGDIRGLGLMIGVELVKNKETKERASEERDDSQELRLQGCRLRCRGLRDARQEARATARGEREDRQDRAGPGQ